MLSADQRGFTWLEKKLNFLYLICVYLRNLRLRFLFACIHLPCFYLRSFADKHTPVFVASIHATRN